MVYDVLVVGGVAAGTKVAAKAKRENPNLTVAILTDGVNISYAGCGLPYYIGGFIREQQELIVKKPAALKADFDIDVFTQHEVVTLLPEQQSVVVRDLLQQSEKTFQYNKLVLATGAAPFVPPIAGTHLKNLFTVRKVEDAVAIREQVPHCQNAVIIGGGFIGLEVAENLKKQNLNVSVLEAAPHILPNFDQDVALHLENYLREAGVNIYSGEKAEAILGEASVTGVKTSEQVLPADLVIMAIGVRPRTDLAKQAGIDLGPTGAIAVNNKLETNLPNIYAVGDCAENVHALTGKPVWIPLGSTANKAGRVAGTNLAERTEEISGGVLGTMIIKLFDMAAAKTGLSEREAIQLGYDIETVFVPANDKAHYYPGYRNIITKLIADKKSRKVLGAQIFGEGVIDKPIDVLVTAITFGATVDDLAKLDLAYAPPFSMAMASTIVAANVMRNKLDGKLKSINPLKLHSRLNDPNLFILDLGTEPEFMIGTIPGAVNIPVEELPERVAEVPKDKEVVALCKVGKRAYLTLPILEKLGYENIIILDGGVAAYPFELE